VTNEEKPFRKFDLQIIYLLLNIENCICKFFLLFSFGELTRMKGGDIYYIEGLALEKNAFSELFFFPGPSGDPSSTASTTDASNNSSPTTTAGTYIASNNSSPTTTAGTYIASNNSSPTTTAGTYIASNNSSSTTTTGNYIASNHTLTEAAGNKSDSTGKSIPLQQADHHRSDSTVQ
jgi:hypothetical protein